MRVCFTFAAIAVLSLGLGACAVVDAGAAVVSTGASVAGTAVRTTADMVTAPLRGSDSGGKKQ